MPKKENASEHFWRNEYSSTKLNTAWTHFLASFNYLNLSALLVVFHAWKKNAVISVKSMKVISLFGLGNSKMQ